MSCRSQLVSRLWRVAPYTLVVAGALPLAAACGGGEFSSEGSRPDATGGSAGSTSSGGTGTGGSSSSTGGSSTGGSSASGGGGSGGRGGSSANGGDGGTGAMGGSGGAGNTGGGVGGNNGDCVPGTLECDADPPRRCDDTGQWQPATCGPLLITDVTGLDAAGLPGFHAVGFRCKALSVCAVGQPCLYFADHLGTLQSGEEIFYDGLTALAPTAVFVQIRAGAASQCVDAEMTLMTGEKLVIFHDGVKHFVYFPAATASDITLYVREDGATFYDASLTQRAAAP